MSRCEMRLQAGARLGIALARAAASVCVHIFLMIIIIIMRFAPSHRLLWAGVSSLLKKQSTHTIRRQLTCSTVRSP